MPSQTQGDGIVYLVGAGPGDPDLVTVRAKYLLENCDAVVYDSLIPYELILTLPAEVEHHYVGKEAGRHSLPQPEINALLAKLASSGKRVVRLKGGDPFVFGRGGEEAEYLGERGLRYEVVPGITSGVAALAYAGIPCTDRRDASYVVFLTGHKAVEKASSGVPWEWVAQARHGTLVIYMGVAEIGNLVDGMISSGMPADTPAAVVERGTFSTQRTVCTALSDLPAKVIEHGIKPPSLFVLGEVTRYGEKLRWFRKRPLFGVRVMITRPADQAVPLYRELRELGAEVLAFPTIATAESFDSGAWEQLRRETTGSHWIVFTSENGVRYFLKQWFTTGGDVRGLSDYRLAAAGDGTILALNNSHIKPDFAPPGAKPDDLARQLAGKCQSSRASVIRVRSNLGDDKIETIFKQAGVETSSLCVYRTFFTKWPPEATKKLFAHPPHVILFTSGTAVKGLAENLEDEELKRLAAGAVVVSIGPMTSETIRSVGIDVDIESKKQTMADVVKELLARHAENKLINGA